VSLSFCLKPLLHVSQTYGRAPGSVNLLGGLPCLISVTTAYFKKETNVAHTYLSSHVQTDFRNTEVMYLIMLSITKITWVHCQWHIN
jgi:hypothetical protein